MIKSFSVKDGRMGGVYSITHKPTGKIYIGSAICFNVRYRGHKNQIKYNKESPYLQRFYDKNNPNDFHMEIVEHVSNNKTLLESEQAWINKYFDKQNMCFNISPTAGNCLGVKASEKKKQTLSLAHKELWKTKDYRDRMLTVASLTRKQYSLLSPDNVLYEGTGIENFCVIHDLHVAHMCKIVTGQFLSYKGWRLPENKEYHYNRETHCKTIGLKRAGTFDVKLMSPDGKIFGPIVNLKAFCQEHDLHRVSIRKLAKKEIKQTKGWVLYNE